MAGQRSTGCTTSSRSPSIFSSPPHSAPEQLESLKARDREDGGVVTHLDLLGTYGLAIDERGGDPCSMEHDRDGRGSFERALDGPRQQIAGEDELVASSRAIAVAGIVEVRTACVPLAVWDDVEGERLRTVALGKGVGMRVVTGPCIVQRDDLP